MFQDKDNPSYFAEELKVQFPAAHGVQQRSGLEEVKEGVNTDNSPQKVMQKAGSPLKAPVKVKLNER